MNATQGLQVLREIKDVAFATVDEDGKPQNRIIDVMIVEEEKLYFCTARGKDFYRQLTSEKYVAITGMNEKYQMVRLSGKAELLEDQKYWIDRIFTENPSMQYVYPRDTRTILDAFCISSGEIEFFDLGQEPPIREYVAFGESRVTEVGFEIAQDCIGCGKCVEVCPTGCITEGTRYQIAQSSCLHCGSCFENCPVSAIFRK